VSGTGREVLTWAAEQIGTTEKPHGSNIQHYAALAGHANGQPWCATFIVAGLKVNHVPLVRGTDTAGAAAMHAAFRKAGRLFNEPRAGDVGHKFHAELGRVAHVFLVERVVGDFVQTVEGNTNLDGSRTGVGVFRLRRRWRHGGTIHGFGRPLYAATPTTPSARSARPVVSLSNLVEAARHDPPARQGATSHPADVRIVEAALVAEGLLSPTFAKDGSFGTVTVTAYAQWQRRQRFSGKDADGIPGRQTLIALGVRHGFGVKD